MSEKTSSGASLDRARVLHIAKLAALSLSDEEADGFARELAAIVGYVEQLDTLDTEGVPANVGVARGALRADETAPCLSHEDALAQAPKVENDGFAVPGFLE